MSTLRFVISTKELQMIIHVFVSSWLDYRNSLRSCPPWSGPVYLSELLKPKKLIPEPRVLRAEPADGPL